MRVLIVKVSSMGDVIHALPVVRDLKRFRPDIEIDWVVEEAFAEIVRAHPDVTRVLPYGLRRWKKKPFAREHWQQWRTFRDSLQAQPYDAVFELQGLFKTALLCRIARGKSFGFNRAAAKEPLSACLLDAALPIKRDTHMIEQLRSVPAQALGYTVQGLPDFGLDLSQIETAWTPPAQPYAVLLHMTAAAYKLWPEANWIELARALLRKGVTPVLPWGSPVEQERAARVVQAVGGGVVAPRLGLLEWGQIMQGAQAVVGLDTGLSHLAAATGARTVFLFGATPRWRIAPYWSLRHATLGEPGHWPAVADVMAALKALGATA
ncbi:MAG: lipopolysaccharide heptosyltransferase I [Burkholderiaceae bacterium]|nr:MAG: lipopolysaccharide heptosyltransferase I [Burkholderiaceae bacterium]